MGLYTAILEAHAWDGGTVHQGIDIIYIFHYVQARTDGLPCNAEMAEQANNIEKRLGINIIDLIRTERQLGFGFVLGAISHGSNYGQSANSPQTLYIAMRLCSEFDILSVGITLFELIERSPLVAKRSPF